MRPIQWLLVMAGFALAAAMLAWLPPASTQEDPVLGIRFDDRHYHLAALDGLRLEQRLHRHLDHHQEQLHDDVRVRIDTQLDLYFQAAHARIPDFADWYYSLGAEYVRLSWPLLARAGLVSPGGLANRMQDQLFGPTAPEHYLTDLQMQLTDVITRSNRDARQRWEQEVSELLAQRASPRAVPTGATLDLQSLNAQLLGYESAEFVHRIATASTTATITGGAAALSRAALQRAGQRTAAGAGSRLAGRTLGRAGGSAGSMLACAPAGPVALGCALATGLATWLAVDWGLLQWDAQQHRSEMEQQLARELEVMQEELESYLHSVYENAMLNQRTLIRADIHRTFVPAQRFLGQRVNS